MAPVERTAYYLRAALGGRASARRASFAQPITGFGLRGAPVMLVVCGRCETEYEFDDALLSERGTTVKCTNCGYQFKVRPPRGARAGGENWSVKRSDGAELKFPSLRELRRAIDSGLLRMEDMLSRDGGPPRRLEDVPELAALFRRQQSGPTPHAQTLMGVGIKEQAAVGTKAGHAPAVGTGPTPAGATAAPIPKGAGGTKIGLPQARADVRSEAPAEPPPTSLIDLGAGPRRTPVPRRPVATPGGTPVAYESFSSEDRKSASFATVPPPAPGKQPRNPELAATWTSPSHEVEEQAPVVDVTAAPVEPAPATPRSRDVEPAAPGEAPPVAAQPSAAVPASAVQFASVPPPAAGSSPESSRPRMAPAPLSVPPPPRRASGLRWVVGFVLVGGLALLAGTVGKNYLAQFVGGDSASSDARVQSITDQAWELFRDGDLAATQAKFEEAAALANNDPQVKLGLIQLNLVRADIEWLRMRLLPESAEAERTGATSELQARLGEAKRAFSTVPRLPDTAERTALMETDALRLQGQYEQARALVERYSFEPTDPHAAYVLAMLDVAEGSQAWATVLERLRTALVSERALGRARSALVYALAASGDERAARVELTKLQDGTNPHPLAKQLEAFIETLAAGTEGEGQEQAGDGTDTAALDIDEVPDAPTPASGEGTSNGKGAAWLWLDKAGAARRSGDLPGAKGYYQKALDASPGNANALAGLGAIARLDGKYQEAKRYFDEVLERSPNHLPALVGGADVRWLMGAKEGALVLYRQIPAGSPFYSHAQRRIADFEGRGGASPDADESEADEAAEATKPSVDTQPKAGDDGDDGEPEENPKPKAHSEPQETPDPGASKDDEPSPKDDEPKAPEPPSSPEEE